MVRSIVDQNKHLSDAAKTPKDTSSRLANANKYSAKISSASAEHRPDSDIGGTNFKQSGNKIKGSLAGLQNNSSTMLQFNNVGYDSKSNQKARFLEKKPFLNGSSFGNNSFTLNKNYSIMNNYSSITAEKSSSDRLSNIIRNNNF